jgi:hypothetical protein
MVPFLYEREKTVGYSLREGRYSGGLSLVHMSDQKGQCLNFDFYTLGLNFDLIYKYYNLI